MVSYLVQSYVFRKNLLIIGDKLLFTSTFKVTRKKEAMLSEKLGEIRSLKEKLLSLRLASLTPTDKSICVFEDGCDSGLLRKLVNDGLHLTGGLFAAFSARDAGGYAYVIGAKEGDLSAFAQDMSASLGGRGGGKGTMITGFVEADEESINNFFEESF